MPHVILRCEPERLARFGEAQIHQLDANSDKGHWRTLLEEHTPAEAALVMVNDLAYHVAKLACAVTMGHEDGTLEYSADSANEAMMVADLAGLLDVDPEPTHVMIGEVAGQAEGSYSGSVLARELHAAVATFEAEVARALFEAPYG